MPGNNVVINVNLTQCQKPPLSSNKIPDLLNSFHDPIDTLTTPFRICQVFRKISWSDSKTNHLLHFIMQHCIISNSVVGTSFLLALWNMQVEYDRMQTQNRNYNAAYFLECLQSAFLRKNHYEHAVRQRRTQWENIKRRVSKRLSSEAKHGHFSPEQNPLFLLECNNYLKKSFMENTFLQEKYVAAELVCNQDQQLILQVQKKSNIEPLPTKIMKKELVLSYFNHYFINKFTSPAWRTISLATVTFWMLWTLRDVLSVLGITGVITSTPLFGIPIFMAVFCLGIKVYHFFCKKDKAENCVETDTDNQFKKEIYVDSLHFLRSVNMQQSFASASAKMQRDNIFWLRQLELENNNLLPVSISKMNSKSIQSPIDYKINRLQRNQIWVAAAAGISATAGAFGGGEFNSWMLSNMLQSFFNIVLPGVSMILGGIILSIAISMGIYAAIEKKQKLNEDTAEIKKHQQSGLIAEMNQGYLFLHAKQSALNQLRKSIRHEVKIYNKLFQNKKLNLSEILKLPTTPQFHKYRFFYDISRHEPTSTSKIKKVVARIFKFIMGAELGIFWVRAFTIVGQAVFVPIVFGLPSVALAALALMIIVGIIYGAFKAYEYHKTRQEERDRLFVKQLPLRSQCLQEEIRYTEKQQETLLQRLSMLKTANSRAQGNKISPAWYDTVLGPYASVLTCC